MTDYNVRMENNTIDQNRQAQAKQYARLSRRLIVVDLSLGAAYILVWLVFDWSAQLKVTLSHLTSYPWFLVAAFAAVFGGIYYLLGLPLSYYSSYILPHRFEMSNQNLKGWITDQAKGIGLSAVFGGLILEIVYVFLRAYPQTWWLWVAGVLLLFNVILANLAPVLLMPLFYKIEPLGEEFVDLRERLIRLAERAGTSVHGVFKFDISQRTKAANAALTGLGSTRRIILGDTLLEEFNDDEIETILAHELGHHVHHDIPIGIALESILTLGGLYLVSLGLKWGVIFWGYQGVADVAAMPLFALVLGAYGLITMPLGNTYSRWRERSADKFALEITGKPRDFASAMIRLANQNLAEVDPETWVEWLLHSHPALSKRIALADKFEATNLE